jgi:hypothetical protein
MYTSKPAFPSYVQVMVCFDPAAQLSPPPGEVTTIAGVKTFTTFELLLVPPALTARTL